MHYRQETVDVGYRWCNVEFSLQSVYLIGSLTSRDTLEPRTDPAFHASGGILSRQCSPPFRPWNRCHTYPSFWDSDTASREPCHTRSGCQRRTPSRLWAASTERAANAL